MGEREPAPARPEGEEAVGGEKEGEEGRETQVHWEE